VGGAPVSQNLADRASADGWPLITSYGMTESASHIALGGPDLGAGLTPLAGTRISVVDDSGAPAAGIGRIVVEGPTIMAGYANPGLLPGDGLSGPNKLMTSDLGQIDESGRLRVTGRCDDVLISGGVNVHPAVLEDVLAGCPGVIEAGIAGRPDPVWGHRLVAVYVGHRSAEELAPWIEEHIAPAMRPREFIRVSALPRNALGKLDRRLLGLLAESPAAGD
jgi:O-succinylbenzoic acid--CoA ligase